MFSNNLKDTFCRTCLITLYNKQDKLEKYNLFNTEDLAQKLMLCSGLMAEPSDEYPQQVCLDCFNKIIQFYEFREMSRTSLERYEELLENQVNIKEENLFEAGEENEDIQMIFVSDREQLQEVTLRAEPVIESNLSHSPKKKKRGRPPNNTDEKNKIPKSRKIFVSEREQLQEVKLSAETGIKIEVLRSPEKKKRGRPRKIIEQNGIPKSKRRKALLENAYKPSFKCDRCEAIFYHLNRLDAHKRQHDGLPAYTCSIMGCERSFNRWFLYKQHRIKDHKQEEEKSYRCDLDDCGKICKSLISLNTHKHRFHNIVTEKMLYECELCDKTFKNLTQLNIHSYTHLDPSELPYACNEPNCTKRCSTKAHLETHQMRHAGIKNFKCPHCDMRKTTRTELEIHINSHTHEKTWPCRLCSKVFYNPSTLSDHVKTMHDRIKNFACRFCDRAFAKAYTRKTHEMTHTGEKPHECHECGKRFIHASAIKAHRQKHLREKSKTMKKGSRKLKPLLAEENVNAIVETEGKNVDDNLDEDAMVIDNKIEDIKIKIENKAEDILV